MITELKSTKAFAILDADTPLLNRGSSYVMNENIQIFKSLKDLLNIVDAREDQDVIKLSIPGKHRHHRKHLHL